MTENIQTEKRSPYENLFKIPKIHVSSTLDNYLPQNKSQEKLLEIVRLVLQGDERGLYIYGKYGVGKTHILSAMAKKLKEKKPDVVFLKFSQFVDHLFGNPDIFYYKKSDVFNVEDLILDEIVTSVEGWGTRDLLRRLIEHRYDNCLRTIMSSNYSVNEMIEFMSPDPVICGRVKSRIYDMYYVVKILGKDYRLIRRKR